jgi:hypothetical protein
MRPRDRRWLEGTARGPFDPYRLRHRETLMAISEYRNGLIDTIEFLAKFAATVSFVS